MVLVNGLLNVLTVYAPHSAQTDLAPSDRYLFPKLNEFIKGSKFAHDKDIISTAKRAYSTILL